MGCDEFGVRIHFNDIWFLNASDGFKYNYCEGSIKEMKVKCIANRGSDLFERTRLLHLNLLTTGWPIDIGEFYEVYGMPLWDGNLHYLIVNRYKGKEKGPVLCPAELFEVTDPGLSKDWYFSYRGTEKENDAIWGYKELVLIPKHLEDIQEREEDALNIFLQRKRELDRAENLNNPDV